MSTIVPIKSDFTEKRKTFFLKISKILPSELLEEGREMLFQSGDVSVEWLDYLFDPKNKVSWDSIKELLDLQRHLSNTCTSGKAPSKEPAPGKKSVPRDRDHKFFRSFKYSANKH